MNENNPVAESIAVNSILSDYNPDLTTYTQANAMPYRNRKIQMFDFLTSVFVVSVCFYIITHAPHSEICCFAGAEQQTKPSTGAPDQSKPGIEAKTCFA